MVRAASSESVTASPLRVEVADRGRLATLVQGARGMRVYLAGSLFSDAERAFNAEVAGRIERLGFEVPSPAQR